MRYAVKVVETGAVAATAARLATSLMDRMKGLLGTRSLPAGEGLILRPCTGVHTFFMKFPLDLVFLDRSMTVRKIVRDISPNRGGISGCCFQISLNSKYVLAYKGTFQKQVQYFPITILLVY